MNRSPRRLGPNGIHDHQRREERCNWFHDRWHPWRKPGTLLFWRPGLLRPRQAELLSLSGPEGGMEPSPSILPSSVDPSAEWRSAKHAAVWSRADAGDKSSATVPAGCSRHQWSWPCPWPFRSPKRRAACRLVKQRCAGSSYSWMYPTSRCVQRRARFTVQPLALISTKLEGQAVD